MVYIGLNPSEHERTAPTGGNPLPAGLYTGVITRTQLKDTKDSTGKYLEVEFDISGPPEFSNRKFWDRFNIINRNSDAIRIAKQQLGDLTIACGLESLTDDTDLHGKEVTLVLKVRPATKNQDGSDKFQATNECQKYWPVGATLDDHNAWMKSSKKGGAVNAAPTQKPGWGNKSAATTENMHGDKALDPASGKPATGATKPWARK